MIMMAEGYEAWWLAWTAKHPDYRVPEAVQAAWNAGAQQAMHEEGYSVPPASDCVE